MGAINYLWLSSVHRFSPLVSKHLLKLTVLLCEADFELIVKAENVELQLLHLLLLSILILFVVNLPYF